MTSCQLSARSQAYSSTSSTWWRTENTGRRSATGGAGRLRGRLRPCMGHLFRGRERTRQAGRLSRKRWRRRGARGGASGPCGLELERRAVDAVAQTRAVARPIREDVAEVSLAARTAHLGALHEVGAVCVLADEVAVGRLVEAGPARARL